MTNPKHSDDRPPPPDSNEVAEPGEILADEAQTERQADAEDGFGVPASSET